MRMGATWAAFAMLAMVLLTQCTDETIGRTSAASSCPPEPTTLNSSGEPVNAAGFVRECWPGERHCHCDHSNNCYSDGAYVACVPSDAGPDVQDVVSATDASTGASDAAGDDAQTAPDVVSSADAGAPGDDGAVSDVVADDASAPSDVIAPSDDAAASDDVIVPGDDAAVSDDVIAPGDDAAVSDDVIVSPDDVVTVDDVIAPSDDAALPFDAIVPPDDVPIAFDADDAAAPLDATMDDVIAPFDAAPDAPADSAADTVLADSAPDVPADSAPDAAPSFWQPPVGARWQWQLSGTLDTTVDAAVYDIDMFDNAATTIASLHAAGRHVICYISAGSWEDWRPDASAFPAVVLGARYKGYHNERWLDIRRIDLLAGIMNARLDLARSKGCDAIEPDNIDGYTNGSGFPLTPDDQLAYNRWFAGAAHARGLSVGLKNDSDQVGALVAAFDFAVTEQCFQYNECPVFSPFVSAGKAVFEAEYRSTTGRICPPAAALHFSAIRKRTALDAWIDPCP